jgi:hypothetical protein
MYCLQELFNCYTWLHESMENTVNKPMLVYDVLSWGITVRIIVLINTWLVFVGTDFTFINTPTITCNINSVNRLMLCLCICQCSDYLGLSLELGSFLAGVMISTTDFAQHTMEQVLFCILFSTLWHDLTSLGLNIVFFLHLCCQFNNFDHFGWTYQFTHSGTAAVYCIVLRWSWT